MRREYTAADITVLEATEHVRRRPAMYVGGIGKQGLHYLVRILLDGGLDEAVEGYCRHLTLTLHADDRVQVDLDGRGIPVAPTRWSKTALEHVFTSQAACFCGCGETTGHRRKLQNRLGPSVTNALSKWLVVETNTGGKRYRMRFERGKAMSQLECLGPSSSSGTRIQFQPDRTIFAPSAQLDWVGLVEELHAMAALAPGLTVELIDQRVRRPATTFQCLHGLGDLAQSLSELPQVSLPIVRTVWESWPEDDGKVQVRLAVQADAADRERLIGFVNLTRIDAGTHIDGLMRGLDQGFQDAAQQLGLPVSTQRPQGLIAVLAIDFPYPQFEGGTGNRLGNPAAREIVERVARDTISQWGAAHPNELRELLEART